jgi:hypothetical protein
MDVERWVIVSSSVRIRKVRDQEIRLEEEAVPATAVARKVI